jgi:uncharacterized protein
MGVTWDPSKAEANFRNHGILFSVDLESVLTDPYSLTVPDDESDPNERRGYTLGLDSLARLLVIVYTWRGERKDYERNL